MKKALDHLCACDPVLAAIIARLGKLEPAYRPATFESLARAIVFQQLNGKAARTIWQRVVDAAGGEPVTPEKVLAVSPERLRACGLSKQKLSYLLDLAAKARSREIDFEQLPRMSDEEVIEHLTRVKGIGVWSAQMFLMFALRRPDVLPTGDYGIRAAMKKHYRMRKLPAPKRMQKIARAWKPHTTLACYYLWRSLDTTL